MMSQCNDIFLFKPSTLAQKGLYAINQLLISEWTNYVYRDIDIDSSPEEVELNLFNHNINQLEKPIRLQTISLWVRLSTHIQKNHQNIIIQGQTLRDLYELSDKSQDIIDFTSAQLTTLLRDDELQFVVSNKRNDSTLDTFYGLTKTKLLRMYVESVSKYGMYADDSIKLAKYVFKPESIDNFQPSSNVFYTDSILKITNDFPHFLKKIATTPKERLEYIVAITCLSAILVDLPNRLDSDDNKCIKTINNIFESEFPEEYKQHQTLKSLGITPKPSEFLTQLNSQCINTFELPELN